MPKRAIKVAVASNSFSKDEALKKSLLQRFPAAAFNTTGKVLAGAELVSLLKGCEASIIGTEKIDGALLDACPEIRVISKYGVGMDNVDLPGCRARGVEVLTSPGINAFAVAELTLGLMIGLARRIAIGTHFLKSGQWVKNGGVQALGKTVGLVGLGHVGKQTAKLLMSAGCKILAHDILDLSAYCASNSIEFCSLDRILSESDFVSLHTPLTPKTLGMIGREQLRKMKPSAFLINTARGGIVEERALAEALRTGNLAGAAFDVFAEEPTQNRELLDLENFIGTAHVAGNSREAIHAMGTAAILNLLKHYGLKWV